MNKKESLEKKDEVVKGILKDIEKQFGKGSIMLLGDQTELKCEVISSGSYVLDKAMGVGGYPRGRIIEIFGPESSGKTTVALHAISEAQKLGGYVAFIDTEHALDPLYAKNLGVDLPSLVFAQPDSGEQALEMVDTLVKTGQIDLIVIDSVAALVPQAEIDGEMGEAHVGILARLMSQAMRKLSGVVAKTKTVVIFINQIREKIGVMFGNPETTTGGRALKFYSSIRLEVRKGEAIKDGADIVGSKVVIKVAKNKVAPPFKVANLDLLFGKGISKHGELVDLACEYGIIDKSGAWYAYNNNKIGQGREAAKNFLVDNPELYKEIETKLLKLIYLN